MGGKIFAESINLYQDQAKILFEFYRDAAEKIVTEEERLEKEISVATEYQVQLSNEISKGNSIKIISFAIMAIFFIGDILLAVLSNSPGGPMIFLIAIVGIGAGGFAVKKLMDCNKWNKELADTDIKIENFKKLHQEIFRDYKVSKMGIAYVPVAGQIAFEDKSFLIDYTGSKNNESFVLQTLRQSELFTSKITELESLLKEVPMVENSIETEVVDTEQYSTSIQKVVYHDYFGKLDRNLRTSAFCMEDLDVTSVSLPVILPESDYAQYLSEYSTANPGKAPLIKPFDTSKYEEDIARFHSLNEMKKSLERHSEQFEDVLKNLMFTMANSVQAITKLKVSTTNRLIDDSNQLLFRILKASYNHYSPLLEAEEIERIRTESFDFSQSSEKYEPFQLKQSSKVKYDLMSECWIAEDGSKTNFPFGMHQIHEEIVAPIVQNLMQETSLERFKIYNNIKDQKISYLNKWHQDTEDFYGRNRAESNDLINIMRSTLSEYVAAFNTLSALENTEKSMTQNASLKSTVVETKNNSAEVFSAFELKSKEFQNIQTEFADYMERLKNDIEVRAEKFEHIEYYDASLRDSSPKNMAVATNRMLDLDPRRKQLIAVNPFYAETSELPPEPNIENLTHEHMSINLSAVAKAALNDLNDVANAQPNDIADDDFTYKTTPPDEIITSSENIGVVEASSGIEKAGEPEQGFVPIEDNTSRSEDLVQDIITPDEKPVVSNEDAADEITAPEPDTIAEPEKEETFIRASDENTPSPADQKLPFSSAEIDAMAKYYNGLFATEFADQIIFVSPVSINTSAGFDAIQLACEEKIALEGSANFMDLLKLDKSNKHQPAWTELKDEDDNILYTLEILLIGGMQGDRGTMNN